MVITLNKSFFLIFGIQIAFLYATEEPRKQEELLQAESRLEMLLKEIPIEKIMELRILQERQQIIKALLESNKENKEKVSNETVDKDEACFQPKKPEMLTDIKKKQSALDRIKEQFIGDIHPEMLSTIHYFDHHKEYRENNINASNRMLLYGQPGTGKTHFFKVISQELQVLSFYFPASFFADKFFGESSRRVRKVFEIAKKTNVPFLIFIDEIDAIGGKRKDTAQDEQKSILITLLTEIQEMSNNKNIFIIVATNDIDSLDPAVIDRFPSKCHVERLNFEQRKKLIMKIFKDNNLPLDVELATRLSEATEKYKYRAIPDSDKYIHPDSQVKSAKDFSYSNRDLEYIVTTAKERQFNDCTIDKKDCTKKLCTYFNEILARMAKDQKDVDGRRIINCDNMK